jgi:hypothetical protein
MGFGINILDLTALGHKAGSPQLRYHDEYDD